MTLKELLGDPSWLFDFGFPVLEFPVAGDASSLEKLEWELGDEYRLPELSSLGNEPRFAEVALAWCDAGLLIHAVARTKGLKQSKPADGSLIMTVYLDTRWGPDVHRANSNCHHFQFLVERPVSTKCVRGHGELASISRARSAPRDIHPKDIYVGSLHREFGYEIKAFLRSDTLTGFQPREFPELGFFYVLTDASLGSQCLARNRNVPFFEDPSLWCRATLIASSE